MSYVSWLMFNGRAKAGRTDNLTITFVDAKNEKFLGYDNHIKKLKLSIF